MTFSPLVSSETCVFMLRLLFNMSIIPFTSIPLAAVAGDPLASSRILWNSSLPPPAAPGWRKDWTSAAALLVSCCRAAADCCLGRPWPGFDGASEKFTIWYQSHLHVNIIRRESRYWTIFDGKCRPAWPLFSFLLKCLSNISGRRRISTSPRI